MSKRKKFMKFLRSALIMVLCLFLSFSVFGCIPYYGTSTSGGSGGSSSGSGSGGSGTGGSGSGGGSSTPETTTPEVLNVNDVYLGTIGVYYLDPTDDEAFFDKFKNSKVSYEFLFNRQFDVMAQIITDTLNYVYNEGNISSNPNISISGQYGSSISLSPYSTILGGTGSGISGYADAIDNWSKNDKLNNYSYITAGLKYLYKDTSYSVTRPSNEITIQTNIDQTLKDNINLIPSSFETSDYDVKDFPTLGINREFLWKVAYFLAFNVIGEDELNNSYNAKGQENEGDDYKKYEIIIPTLVESLSKLYINGSSVGKGTDNTDISDKTLFPTVKCEKYVFYDTVELLSDADNGMLDDDDDYSDDDYDDSGEDDADYTIDTGSTSRPKQIILVPKIDSSKYTGTDFGFAGILIGFNGVDLGGNTEVQIGFETVALGNNGHKEICEPLIDDTSKNIVNKNRIIVDYTFSVDDDENASDPSDLIDVQFPLTYKFSTAQTLTGLTVDEVINQSFNTTTKNVTYSSSGERFSYEIGVLNVYNSLFTDNADFYNLNFASSIITINLQYFKNNGSAYDGDIPIPETNIMVFTPYD